MQPLCHCLHLLMRIRELDDSEAELGEHCVTTQNNVETIY